MAATMLGWPQSTPNVPYAYLITQPRVASHKATLVIKTHSGGMGFFGSHDHHQMASAYESRHVTPSARDNMAALKFNHWEGSNLNVTDCLNFIKGLTDMATVNEFIACFKYGKLQVGIL